MRSILDNPDVLIAEIREPRAHREQYGERDFDRIKRDLASLVKQERRMIRLLRLGEVGEEHVLGELADIKNQSETLKREKQAM